MSGIGVRKSNWAGLAVLVILATKPAQAGPTTLEANHTTIEQSSPDTASGFLPRHSPAAASPRPAPNLTGVGAASLLWPTLIVVGALVVLAVMMKRWKSGPGGSNRRGGLEILSRQFISNKQSLCVVRFGRRLVCLGITPERISTLAQLDDPDEASEVYAAAARTSPASFTRMLETMSPPSELDSEDAPAAAGVPPSVVGQDVRRLLARVRAMADARSSAEAA